MKTYSIHIALAAICMALAAACGGSSPTQVERAPSPMTPDASGVAEADNLTPTPVVTPEATATAPPPSILVVAASADGELLVFRDFDDEPIAVIPTVEGAHNVAVAPGGRWVAVTSPDAGEVSIIDMETFAEVARLAIGQRPHDVVSSPDGSVLYIGRDSGTMLQVVEVGTWRLLDSIDVGVGQHNLAFNADATELWMAIGLNAYPAESRSVLVLDLDTLTVVDRIDTGRDAHDIVRSPDGREFWVTNSGDPSVVDDHVSVIDAATHAVRQLHVGEYPAYPIKVERDVSAPETVTPSLVWFADIVAGALLGVDPALGRISEEIEMASPALRHMALDPFGRAYVADGGSDSVIVIDLATGSVVARLPVADPHGVALVLESGPSTEP